MLSNKKNMRMLVFGEAFLPPAYMPRLRYFISYLIEKGWEVELIIEGSVIQDNISTDIPVHIINYYRFKKGIWSRLEWLLKFSASLFFDYKGNYFSKKSEYFTKNKKYDIVFCSSCFTFPLTTAAKVAKGMNIPLIVDLRDIAEQSPDDNYYLDHEPPKLIGSLIIKLYKKIHIGRRNKVLKIANGVTTVSPWHVNTLSKFNPNVNLIYNGFDENIFVPEIIKTDFFTISHFGRIYSEEMRNPRLLFSAIQNLSQNGKISAQNVRIKWFVDQNSINVLRKILNDYDIDEFIELNTFIKQNELTNEMNRSSMLLILSTIITKNRYFGIMTTKLFESIGANRPILCIPKNDDNLSELIEKENCGLISSDVLQIEEYIYKQFDFWKKNGFTVGNIPESTRMNFSRKKGAEVLERILISNINQKQL